MSDRYSWGTESELEYIRKLGTGTHGGSKTDITRVMLLKSYLKAAKARYNWGPIDKIAVIEFVEKELAGR